jgi:hypothetical protein
LKVSQNISPCQHCADVIGGAGFLSKTLQGAYSFIQKAESLTMSALPSEADIRASLRQVCFVPRSDIRPILGKRLSLLVDEAIIIGKAILN